MCDDWIIVEDKIGLTAGEKSLNIHITSLQESLRTAFEDDGYKVNFDDQEKIFREAIDNQTIYDSYLTDQSFEFFANPEFDMKLPLDMACLYSVLAKKAIEENLNEKAWSYLVEASRWSGIRTGVDFYLHKNNKSYEFQSRINKSNKESEKIIKDEVIRLIENMRKIKGKVKINYAVNFISPSVKKFTLENDLEFNMDTINETLTRWRNKDPEFKERFKVAMLKISSQ